MWTTRGSGYCTTSCIDPNIAFLQQDYRNSIPASSYQQQKLRLCEVCGAFLGIHDNDRRLADHFGGKLHMGFVFLRTKLDELRVSAFWIYRPWLDYLDLGL